MVGDIRTQRSVLEGPELLDEGLEAFFAGVEDGDVLLFLFDLMDDLSVGVDMLAYFMVDVLEVFIFRDAFHVLLLYHGLTPTNYYTY